LNNAMSDFAFEAKKVEVERNTQHIIDMHRFQTYRSCVWYRCM